MVKPPVLVLLLGVAILVLALLVIPWLTFLDAHEADRRVDALINDSRVNTLLEKMSPDLRARLGVPWPLTSATARGFLTSAELQHIYDLVRTRPRLSAWDLWRLADATNGSLRFALLACGLLAVVGVLWSTAWIALPKAGTGLAVLRGGSISLAGATTCVLLLMLWFIPSIDTFGFRDDFGRAFVCMLLGSKAGPGIVVALVGLVLLASAGVLGYVTAHMALVSEQASSATTAFPDPVTKGF